MNYESALLMLCQIHQSRNSPGPFGRECFLGEPTREEFVSKGFLPSVGNISQDFRGNSDIARGWQWYCKVYSNLSTRHMLLYRMWVNKCFGSYFKEIRPRGQPQPEERQYEDLWKANRMIPGSKLSRWKISIRKQIKISYFNKKLFPSIHTPTASKIWL